MLNLIMRISLGGIPANGWCLTGGGNKFNKHKGATMITFKEDSEEYKLWCEIINDIYLEYDRTNNGEDATALTEKIEKLMDKISSPVETRVSPKPADYDSAPETLKHIKRVNQLLLLFTEDVLQRAAVHDQSKLEEPEKSTFDKITPLLRNTTYGSEEYKTIMRENKPGIEHHQLNNTHHPEYYKNGIDGMSLMDIVEMFFDWKAASERHADGNIYKSIEIQQKRFNIAEQLSNIFRSAN